MAKPSLLTGIHNPLYRFLITALIDIILRIELFQPKNREEVDTRWFQK